MSRVQSSVGPWLALGFAWLACVAACGAAPGTAPVGRTAGPVSARPVELTLRTGDGAFVDLGDLRGRPTLVFLFATFDGVSQASLRALRPFALRHTEVHVVGIAAQPRARDLVVPYAAALEIPFTVTYDPEERVTAGATDLGPLEAVPTLVMLDAGGFEVGRHVGLATDRKLTELLALAVRSGEAPRE